jgi:hypothetical protein
LEKSKDCYLLFIVSVPFSRVTLSRAERKFVVVERFGTGTEGGFVCVTMVDGLVCVFTIVDEGLFVVADVKFPFACARI